MICCSVSFLGVYGTVLQGVSQSFPAPGAKEGGASSDNTSWYTIAFQPPARLAHTRSTCARPRFTWTSPSFPYVYFFNSAASSLDIAGLGGASRRTWALVRVFPSRLVHVKSASRSFSTAGLSAFAAA